MPDSLLQFASFGQCASGGIELNVTTRLIRDGAPDRRAVLKDRDGFWN
jgi:hypothetical protein